MMAKNRTLFLKFVRLKVVRIEVFPVAAENYLFASVDEDCLVDWKVWQEDFLDYLVGLALLDADELGGPGQLR